LVGFGEAGFGEPLTNVLALISLQLQHFSVLGVLHYCPVARKFLQNTQNKCHGTSSEGRRYKKTQLIIYLHTFLQARTIFLRSYSEESPWTVVNVFRPFRCWILMWTKPSCTPSSLPLIASAKGSRNLQSRLLVNSSVHIN
jgi:hypothetical protein